MSDLIDRQAAIDALAKFVPYAICDASTESYTNGLTDAYNLICQLPSVQPEQRSFSCGQENDLISRQAAIDKLDPIFESLAIDKIKALPTALPDLQPTCNQLATDAISRQAAIDILDAYQVMVENGEENPYAWARLRMSELPSAQPDIKQAAKLLSDFIESCPCGDSYLIAPDGEALRTDWGYATEGIQLIHDWAERRTDGGGA